ncbi:MAG TPA: TonB-dependent receptor [Opitutaceae bacterium]|nr:TonB-dependent receptor [Opitutaceae bacterium]
MLLAPPLAFSQVASDPNLVRGDTVRVEETIQQDGDEASVVALEPHASPNSNAWDDVAAQVPNLSIESAGTSSFGTIYSIRGLSNTPYFSDPSLALYFDEIPLGGSFSYPSDLLGMASASVHPGPQPAFSGKMGEGGVIVFEPPQSRGSGEVDASLGSYQARSAGLRASGMDGADADYTVSLSGLERQGYIENSQIGRRVDDLHALTGFARQRIRPTSTSELSIEVLADRHHDGAAPLVPLGEPLFSVARSEEGETDTSLYGTAITASLETPIGHLSETTSYTHWSLNPYKDWLVLPPALLSSVTQGQSAWNEEFRFISGKESAIRWDWGTWISSSSTDGSTDRSIKGFIPIEVSDYAYTRHELALFGGATFTPAKGVQISIEARAQETRKAYGQGEQVPVPNLRLDFHRSDAAFLPRMLARFDLSDGAQATLGVSAGTKAGGYAAYTDNPALIPFDPETTVAFEAGLQSSFAQRKAMIALRAFDYEIRNYQIERSFSAADYFVATAPRARSTGIECEASWKPASSWTVTANSGLQDVRLLEFRDPLSGLSHAGDKAPYAPSFTAMLDVSYHSPSGWFGSVRAKATGRTFYTESEQSEYSQAAYLLLQGRAGFETSRWRLSVYVENATDERYYSQIIPGVSSGAPGAPRCAGTEAALKF